MMFTRAHDITLQLPRAAIEAIFNECDRFNVDETGGRILGTYRDAGRDLLMAVNGVIEPGPNAQRSQTYFKQDGAYQELVFRQIEDHFPEIEHLGNWHTHHVNGLKHLSGGDIETYRRTVEHHNHNIDFFYALLVTEKRPGRTGLDRYEFKNYVLRRGDPNVYEIPANGVSIIDAPLVWPTMEERMPRKTRVEARDAVVANSDLVLDQDVIGQFYPKVKTLQSKELGIYWRGGIILADSSVQEVVVLRDAAGGGACTVTLRDAPEVLEPVDRVLGKREFANARGALIATERACNAHLLSSLSHKGRKRKWMF
jgi:hypothetical protein